MCGCSETHKYLRLPKPQFAAKFMLTTPQLKSTQGVITLTKIYAKITHSQHPPQISTMESVNLRPTKNYPLTNLSKSYHIELTTCRVSVYENSVFNTRSNSQRSTWGWKRFISSSKQPTDGPMPTLKIGDEKCSVPENFTEILTKYLWTGHFLWVVDDHFC